MNSKPFKPFTLVSKGRLFAADTPAIMGIINATPDSFHNPSRINIQNAVKTAETMILAGADIIDIGGQSTRPGATQVSANEELDRVLPILEAIRKQFPKTWISIDTFYSKVAKLAIESGADIINDVSAGDDDTEMLKTVSELRVPYIAMHKKGKALDMQIKPEYNNVVIDLIDYFSKKEQQLNDFGIHDWLLDPGFGFGKTDLHNYSLAKHVSAFAIFNRPILVGVSRKGMIQRTLGVNTENALNGTTALHMYLLFQGASILRVHDIREAAECRKIYMDIQNAV